VHEEFVPGKTAKVRPECSQGEMAKGQGSEEFEESSWEET
jgi:hypothetical protein